MTLKWVLGQKILDSKTVQESNSKTARIHTWQVPCCSKQPKVSRKPRLFNPLSWNIGNQELTEEHLRVYHNFYNFQWVRLLILSLEASQPHPILQSVGAGYRQHMLFWLGFKLHISSKESVSFHPPCFGAFPLWFGTCWRAASFPVWSFVNGSAACPSLLWPSGTALSCCCSAFPRWSSPVCPA